MKISAIVFVFWPEEEGLIETCLKTVAWADEIVVIDNGATPKTLTICKKYTGKIFHTPSKDFSARHNLGKQKATGDWSLYIDSDERVSGGLKNEILAALKNPKFDAYQFDRTNVFLGKQVRYGDRYPDYVTRLFKKEKLLGWEGEVHESSKVTGEVGKLHSPFYHLTHRDIFSMMEKTVNFAQYEANLRIQVKHPPVVWWRLLRVIISEFFHRIVKLQGFRQGTEGWIDGIFQSFSLFVAYVRLWEMQQKPSIQQKYQELDKKILQDLS